MTGRRRRRPMPAGALWLALLLPAVCGCALRGNRAVPQAPPAMQPAAVAYAQESIAPGYLEPSAMDDSVQAAMQHPPPLVLPPGEQEPPTREVTLTEAMRVALSGNKEIAVLGYAPEVAAMQVQTEMAIFDPALNFDTRWSQQNQQTSQNIETYGSGRNILRRSIFGPSSGTPEIFSLSRQFAYGTRARMGYLFSMNDVFPVSQFVAVNPAFRNQVGLTVEHPLLRGAGREVNQAPLMVAQAEQSQSQREFEARLQKIVFDLKVAYWQLYAAERDLRTRRRALEAAEAILRAEHEKLRLGETDLASVAQAEAQAQQFHIDRVAAYRRRLDAERELRRLMGLPPADGRLLSAWAEPRTEPPAVEWSQAVQRATAWRPEIGAQRAVVEAAEWEVVQMNNGVLPNVSLVGQYAPNGLNNTLAGSITSLTSGRFADWYMGVRYAHVFGRRADRAAARRAELSLAQERAVLRNLEYEIVHQVQQAYQELQAAWHTMRLQGKLRAAAEKQVRAREALYRNGGYTSIDLLLRSQSTYADAVRDEWQAIGAFNQALARWQYVTGEILTNDVSLVPRDDQVEPAPPPPVVERLPEIDAPGN